MNDTEPELRELTWNILIRANHTNYGDIRNGLHSFKLWAETGWSPEAMTTNPSPCGWDGCWSVRQLWDLWEDVTTKWYLRSSRGQT